MKKYLSLFLVAAALSAFFLIDLKKEDIEGDKPKAGPGHFEFIRSIKGDAPFNAVNNWEKQTRFSKKGGSVLDSIEEIGPFNIGGRTRALVLDKTDANRIFVGAITGGMWVSDASGRGWTKLNDNEITLNISHLAQDPLNPDVFYYCTGEGAGNSGGAPGAGVFKSTDHGKTFFQLPATANGTYDYTWRIAFSPTDSNTLFVATNSSGVYRSKDGGQSFERIVFTNRQVYDLEIFPDGSLLIAIRGQGVYTSPNGDDGTWTSRPTGMPSLSTTGRIEMAYCATQPNVVYAAVSNSSNTALLGVYKSIDQGITWNAVGANPADNGGSYPFTWYCLAMHVKRDDPNKVILGSVNLLYTTNGGSNWVKASNSHADYHVMADHPSKPGKLYIGNDGGVHEYDWNNLATHQNLNWGLNITQFYTGAFAPDGVSLMAGAQDNGTNYSLNANDTFYKAYGADGSYTQISQQDPSLAYLSFQNGRLFRVDGFGTKNLYTTDIIADMDNDGDKDIDDGAWFIHPFDINPQDGEMVFYPTKKRVYRSNNGGILFDPITNPINIGTGIEPFCIGISNQLNPAVYIGGSNSLFYRIKNAAVAKPGDEKNLRSRVPSNLYTSFMGCIKVNPIDPSILYLSYVNYSSVPRVWKVIHADTDTPEFVNISGNLPSGMPVNWIEVDPASPDSVIFAGTDRGLFYTTDGGITWFQEPSIPNVVVDMLRLRMSDRRLFIFTHGRGVFTARVTPYDKPIPVHNTVGLNAPVAGPVNIYPNPANEWITLKWETQESRQKMVSIYDIKGRLVEEALVENGARIDVHLLANGLYFVKAVGLVTRKVLVQHP